MTLSWTHSLHIGDVKVPLCWTKMRGPIRKVKQPEVFPVWLTVSSGAQMDVATEEDEAEEDDETSSELKNPGKENVDLDSLPQGVSYDRESNAFQANIRDSKTRRFLFLGEFTTPERAHQAYLEALPRCNPDKV